MAFDAHGLPIDFEITGGEVHDCKIAPEFIEKPPTADHTIANKGYDSEEVRDSIRKKSSIPVIPRKSNSKIGNADMDRGLYKYRHPVEYLFDKIKHFRAIAIRFDKLKRNYASVVAMACTFLWLPMSKIGQDNRPLASLVLLLRCKRFCGAHLLHVNSAPQYVCALP